MKTRSLVLTTLALSLAPLSAFAQSAAVSTTSADTAARRLIAEIRAELRPVENQIRNAPFLAALERGEVPLSSLRAFAGEQYNIIRSDLRSNAQMVSRFGTTPGGPFFIDLVNGESIAFGLLLDFARALGMSEADLRAYEPRPRAQTYPSYVTALAHYGTDADIAASYLVNFAVFGENTGRMANALRRRYGFSARDTAFFDFFATSDPAFEPAALAIIGAGLQGCANERDIKRSVRLLQAYEKDFWDAVGQN